MLFDSPGDQLTPQGLFNSAVRPQKSRAVLYLFSPRRVGDHFKRPIAYNFNSEFIERAHDAITRGLSFGAASGGIGEVAYPITHELQKLDCAKRVILPSASGIHMATSQFSESWTFMLVVDNDVPEHKTGFYNSSLVANRTVYYGFCVDEPMNPRAVLGSTTLNENGFIVITHKTTINQTGNISRGGASAQHDTVVDVDVIPCSQIGMLTNEKTLLMTPDALQKSTIDEGGGAILTTFGDDQILNNKMNNDNLNSAQNNPSYHGRKIIDAVVAGHQTYTHDQFMGGLSSMPSGEFGQVAVKSQIVSELEDPTNENLIGLRTNQPITIGEICRRYSPEVTRIDVPQAQTFAGVDQAQLSMSNVFSSLVASALPTILSNAGLATLAFMYHSPNRAKQIQNVETFLPISDGEIKMRVFAAIHTLENDLFPIILANNGDFDLMVSCSCGGASHITLNFLNSSQEHGIYETNHVLGGVNTQLIGDTNIATDNALKLNGMISSLTASL